MTYFRKLLPLLLLLFSVVGAVVAIAHAGVDYATVKDLIVLIFSQLQELSQ